MNERASAGCEVEVACVQNRIYFLSASCSLLSFVSLILEEDFFCHELYLTLKDLQFVQKVQKTDEERAKILLRSFGKDY